jgi:diaminohydroxyphosphoribosylaminopyrimidine deaminase/5-amino-6-(5-phosphoribosylamino)uracil reductase
MVKGRGLRALRRAGVEVVLGAAGREARRLNEAYFQFMRTGRPFVTLKVAQTLDGKIATRSGEARWVTSPHARKFAKRMRSEAQAILVGVKTVINDDPELLPVPRRKTFYRCILDTSLSIPEGSRVVKTARSHPTIVYCAEPNTRKARKLEEDGVWVRGVQTARDGMLSVEHVVRDLSCLGVMHLFIEGGSLVSSSFLEAGMIDKIVAFIAPKVLGDVNGLGTFSGLDVKHLSECYDFRIDELLRVGKDALLTLYPSGRKPSRRRRPPSKRKAAG